jgi:hypothetical protein
MNWMRIMTNQDAFVFASFHNHVICKREKDPGELKKMTRKMKAGSSCQSLLLKNPR